MTITSDMVCAVPRARRTLGAEAFGRAGEFVAARACPDGGFRGRSDASDLYYTSFALLASPAAPPATRDYVRAFADGADLDLVHLGCLARARRLLHLPLDALDAQLARRVLTYARDDGGFHTDPSAGCSSAYGCFIAIAALQDLATPLPRPAEMADVLEAMRTPAGGFANTPGAPLATTPATAAAVVALRELGHAPAKEALAWLLARRAADGGFRAAPGLPAPDLLATAVALHALALSGADLSDSRDPCLDYLNSLWDPSGGFRAHWADRELDVEYAFYGLLAAGALSPQ
ncbi:MAG: hypothetical protein NT031_00765 [Planctomycetota bacterium]|nr:hypothetical protein [Planctomycetota bacterium]